MHREGKGERGRETDGRETDGRKGDGRTGGGEGEECLVSPINLLYLLRVKIPVLYLRTCGMLSIFVIKCSVLQVYALYNFHDNVLNDTECLYWIPRLPGLSCCVCGGSLTPRPWGLWKLVQYTQC